VIRAGIGVARHDEDVCVLDFHGAHVAARWVARNAGLDEDSKKVNTMFAFSYLV
jgi:hypothetical protein